MEVVNLLKEEIKRLASEENINVPKLNEYVRIYEKLRAFDTTTVDQVEVAAGNYMFDTTRIPTMQAMPRIPGDNEIGNMLDIFKEIVYDINKPKGRHEIDEYIYWLGFIENIKKNIKKYPITDQLNEWNREVDNLTYKLYERTMGLMKKQLNENIEKETKEMEKGMKVKSNVEVAIV